MLQLRSDGSDVRERLGVVEEFARKWKSVLSLDPRSRHERGGDIPNVHVAERVRGEGYVRVNKVVCAHRCADGGGLPGFDDLLWRERSDEQRGANCDPRLAFKQPAVGEN